MEFGFSYHFLCLGIPCCIQDRKSKDKTPVAQRLWRQFRQPAHTQDTLALSSVSQLVSVKRGNIGQDFEIILWERCQDF